MNKPDALSLKKFILYLSSKSLTLQSVEPTDSDELKELKELDKKGLAKVTVIDTTASFITYKSMLRKFIDDFSNSDCVLSEIADRSQHSYNLIQIYASNISLRKHGLTPEQYQQLAHEEDLILEDYEKPSRK